MSSSEDDYMSDAVLAACGDTRPGLFKSTHESQKRRTDIKSKEAAKQNRTKSIKVQERQRRDEGLAKKLEETNKGFALLQKMGYKAGSALGKTGEGRIEPIAVEVKSNREGLGKEAEKRRNAELLNIRRQQDHVKRMKVASAMQENFRNQKSAEQKYRVTQKYFQQSLRICLQLDTDQGLKEPVNINFWPKGALPQQQDERALPQQQDEDEGALPQQQDEDALPQQQDEDEGLLDEDDSDAEPSLNEIVHSLVAVTAYLRSTHLYCLWCGYSFNNAEDLSNSCPGDTAEDHDEMS